MFAKLNKLLLLLYDKRGGIRGGLVCTDVGNISQTFAWYLSGVGGAS